MAKRSTNPDLLTTSAASLGRTLGRIVAKLDSWRGNRDEIRSELEQVIAHAKEMIQEVDRPPAEGRLASLAEVVHMPPPKTRPRKAAAPAKRQATSKPARGRRKSPA